MDVQSYLQYPHGCKQTVAVQEHEARVDLTPCYSTVDEAESFAFPTYSCDGFFSVSDGFAQVLLEFPDIVNSEHFQALRRGFEDGNSCVFSVRGRAVLRPVLSNGTWIARNLTCNGGCICLAGRIRFDKEFCVINYHKECDFMDLRGSGIENAFICAPNVGTIMLAGNALACVDIECAPNCVIEVTRGCSSFVTTTGIVVEV